MSPRGENSVLGAAAVAGQHQRCFPELPELPQPLELPGEVVLELSWVWFVREPQVRGGIPKASLGGWCGRKLLQPLLHHEPLVWPSKALSQGGEPLPCAAQCPELLLWDWAHPTASGASPVPTSAGAGWLLIYFLS